MIRSATPDDAAAIADIYNHYVLHSIITFEEETVTAGEMRSRMDDIQSRFPLLVHDAGSGVDGYVYATPWKTRSAYRYAVETTVYVHKDRFRRGIGARLYAPLIATLRERGYHAAMAGIALPNDGSVGIHESVGFEKVAHFSEVGRKFDRWIDVGYWQLML